MPMSVDQILAEARQLPDAQRAELFDRLLVESFSPDGSVDRTWIEEVGRRMADIESGREKGIDGDEVLAEIRRIVGR